MKKVVIICLILMINVLSFLSFFDSSFNVFAFTEEIKKYAQIQKENVQFYFSTSGEIGFEIPRTFYVELLADKNENGLYKARYLNKVGFVKSEDVQCVSVAPASTFLNDINFRILASQSAEIRSEPSREKGASTLLSELELYETNFIFYGTRLGEEVVPRKGNVWYYCAYVKGGNEKLGYVYAGLTDELKQYKNLEINSTPIDKHDWSSNNPLLNKNTNESFAIEPPNSSQIAIIVGISIPALLLLIALFRPVKLRKVIKNKETNLNKSKSEKEKNKDNLITLPKSKKQFKAEKGKDFYELK